MIAFNFGSLLVIGTNIIPTGIKSLLLTDHSKQQTRGTDTELFYHI